MTKPLPFTIIIDTREKPAYRWLFDDDHPVKVKKLDTGDYSIEGCEHLICLERKTLSDLIGSLFHDYERFKRELVRMKKIPNRYIVIEAVLRQADVHDYRSKVHPNSIVGRLLAIERDYGIHAIWATDSRTAQWVAGRIFKYFWKEHAK